jgi:hypothetical protein
VNEKGVFSQTWQLKFCLEGLSRLLNLFIWSVGANLLLAQNSLSVSNFKKLQAVTKKIKCIFWGLFLLFFGNIHK